MKDFWIRELGLTRHPEGGAFRESYRSALAIPQEQGLRAASTAIYFLLEEGDFSAFHRIRYDEIWHFYTGSPLIIVEINGSGEMKQTKLGADIVQAERFQHVVPGGTWFASYALGPYSLVGCTVAPGFDFEDFEMANRNTLATLFPDHRAIIEHLTRP
ncbi:MAG: cupin domain-containing protein [Chitinophagaceae bacterium]|nr:cupin domain-containing protein [Oligoflexus sp.]